MGSCIVVLKDKYIPMPTGVGHNSSLSDIVYVVEPSDIPLADVECCPPSHGDPFPNHDTSTSLDPVNSPSRDGDVTVMSDTNQPSLPTPFYSVMFLPLWPFQQYFIP